MRRRQFLASLGIATGVAGCIESGGSESDDPGSDGPGSGTHRSGTPGPGTRTAGRTSSPAPTTADRARSAGPPAAVTLGSAYRYSYETDLIGVRAPDRAQFAFVTPPGAARGPPPEEFALELGDRRISPEQLGNATWAMTPGLPSGPEGVYFTDSPREPSTTGALLFDVPTADVEAAALVRDGTRYPIPDDDLAEFAVAPGFALDSVDVPERVAADERLEMTVTVTNEGGGDGIFLAGFWKSAYPKPLDVPASPGESATGATTYELYDDAEIHFVHAGGTREYEVATATPTSG